jgi:hypothetical protein
MQAPTRDVEEFESLAEAMEEFITYGASHTAAGGCHDRWR